MQKWSVEKEKHIKYSQKFMYC